MVLIPLGTPHSLMVLRTASCTSPKQKLGCECDFSSGKFRDTNDCTWLCQNITMVERGRHFDMQCSRCGYGSVSPIQDGERRKGCASKFWKSLQVHQSSDTFGGDRSKPDKDYPCRFHVIKYVIETTYLLKGVEIIMATNSESCGKHPRQSS